MQSSSKSKNLKKPGGKHWEDPNAARCFRLRSSRLVPSQLRQSGDEMCLACAKIPVQVAAGLRLGRTVVFQKPARGTHALVMGNVVRRLVSFAMAHHVGRA